MITLALAHTSGASLRLITSGRRRAMTRWYRALVIQILAALPEAGLGVRS